MNNIFLLTVLSGVGIVSGLVFIGYFIFLLFEKEKALNRIVINYIFIGFIGCVVYGLMHNFFVHPLLFNALIGFDFHDPKVLGYLITWGYRATLFFLVFSIWLRGLLKSALKWKDRTKIFKLLFVHAALISAAWITDFEKLLYYNGVVDLHHILHWFGGIIGSMMLILLEYLFIERQIIAYLNIDFAFQKLRGRLLFLFLGISSMMLFAFFGIVIGCVSIDPPWLLILKLAIFSVLFLIPLIIIILRITGDFQRNLDQAVTFLRAASAQDFSTSLSIMSRDEFGELTESLDLLKDNFKHIITMVRKSSGEVDGSASKISIALNRLFQTMENFLSRLGQDASRRVESSNNAVDKLNEMVLKIEKIFMNISGQVSLSEQNTSSIRQMTGTISTIADKTRYATEIASTLSGVVEQGYLLIEGSLKGVREIEASSKKINEIIEVIDNVSEQAKILAINAGIEAVHAGAAGKGFSIVAYQMRTLADNTAKNARTIYSLLSEIYGKVSGSLGELKKSKDSFSSVRGYVDKSRDLSVEISKAMQEESTALSDVLSSTGRLSELTKEIALFSGHLKETSINIKETFEAVKNAAYNETKETAQYSAVISEILKGVKELIEANSVLAGELTREINVFKTEADVGVMSVAPRT
jgi:methyl-accepting chemotaxis protein